MSRQKLNYDKNLRAAIVFLNMFKLGVLEKFSVEAGDILPVVDDDMQEVGTINCLEDSINIQAVSDMGIINASYKIESASVTRDIESIGNPRTANWNTNINYEVIKNGQEKLQGLCIISASIDDEFGTGVLARHNIQYLVNGNPVMYLKTQLNGALFMLTLINNDTEENITISPFALSGSFMRHEIKEGQFISGEGYPYHLLTSFLCCENYSTMIVVHLQEQKGLETESKREEVEKVDYNPMYGNCGRGIIPQIGALMQEYDSSTFKTISNIREFLMVGDVSLLDSIINTSLGNYTDAEIEALLGLKKEPIKYKGRVRELKELYFGSKEMKFLE